MELIEGITLKEYIGKKGKLSIKEATSIAIQVSMGLEAAHNHGIVHRDVKPQNIIISTDGKVKGDRFWNRQSRVFHTISSNVMGSVHYSSPEQVREATAMKYQISIRWVSPCMRWSREEFPLTGILQ